MKIQIKQLSLALALAAIFSTPPVLSEEPDYENAMQTQQALLEALYASAYAHVQAIVESVRQQGEVIVSATSLPQSPLPPHFWISPPGNQDDFLEKLYQETRERALEQSQKLERMVDEEFERLRESLRIRNHTLRLIEEQQRQHQGHAPPQEPMPEDPMMGSAGSGGGAGSHGPMPKHSSAY